MQRFVVFTVLLSLLALFAAGCAVMKSALAEPEWSKNYALEGECDIPQLNDGSMYTTGKTHPPEYVRGERPDDSRFSDAIITFKEPKDIRKIVIRRRPEDSVPLDVDIVVMKDDEWQTVKEARGEIGDDVDVRLKIVADKLRIRIQRATRTDKGKAAIAKSSGGGTRGRGRQAELERLLRQPVKLAEIEVYGLKSEEEAQASET
jgi:hypothetical protein